MWLPLLGDDLIKIKDALNGVSCAVLGGGGFIGTHLCSALAASGAIVRGYGRSKSYPSALAGIHWTGGEFSDRAGIARAVEGCELVFHLLGGSTPESSNHDPLGDLISSAAPSVQLMEICRSAGVKKIVFVSSGGTVYGVPKEIPIRESAPTDPISAYGISKLATEKYLHLYHHLYSLDYSIMRVANPFGPFQNPKRRQGVVAALLGNVIQGRPIEIWGRGDVVRDFIFIDDVISALLRVSVYSGDVKIFNVGSGVGRSISEVVDDIALLLGDDSVKRIYKPTRATDVPANVLDITEIQRELSWSPDVPWSVALKVTAEWIKSIT